MTRVGRARGVVAFLLVATTAAIADPMSKDDYIAAKRAITARYTTDRMACDVLSGNAKDVCIAEVKGRDRVLEAELDARYTPSDKTRFAVVIAKMDAAFAVARKRCEDLARQDREPCMTEARRAAALARTEGHPPGAAREP